MNDMKIKLKQYILIILVFILISISSCKNKNDCTENLPNIILFFTDDQGYADLSSYGAEGFDTPHLDQLASEGIKFTNSFG